MLGNQTESVQCTKEWGVTFVVVLLHPLAAVGAKLPLA